MSLIMYIGEFCLHDISVLKTLCSCGKRLLIRILNLRGFISLQKKQNNHTADEDAEDPGEGTPLNSGTNGGQSSR